MNKENCCCPKFNPEPWDEKKITWESKKFVTDRVRSFFHIPLNFGSVMKRIMNKIEESNVTCEDMIILADEDSLWGTNPAVRRLHVHRSFKNPKKYSQISGQGS